MDERPVVDLEQLVVALQDQSGSLRWWLDTDSGEVRVSDDGWFEDESDEDDLENDHLVPIEPLPPHVWYRHMVDFAASRPDMETQQALQQALHGKGPFRRFKDTLYGRYPSLVGEWHDYQEQRAEQVARDWLADQDITRR